MRRVHFLSIGNNHMPMLRNLTLALIICIQLYPIDSFALSLGNMRTQSALNERFRAEIELNAANVADLDALRIALASPADFAREGLDRPFFLNQLRFKPITKNDGSSVIKVTSNTVIREPFLDLLVEINWPKGRIAKKFTVLLDPRSPVDFRTTTATISTPKNLPKLEPKTVSKQRTTVVQNLPPTRPTPPPPVTSQNTAPAKQYGPIQRGNTLMQIANALKANGVKAEQIAAILFRNNPQAFIGNNKNRLKAGAILRIPNDSVVLVRSIDNLPPPPTPTAPVIAETKTVSPLPTAINEKTTGTGQLRIAAQPPNADLLMMREANETNRKETEELRSKVKELESQLIDIRQLLKLKSKQLVEIQNTNAQLAATTPQQPTTTNVTTPVAPIAPPITAPSKTTKPTTKTSVYKPVPVANPQPIAKVEESIITTDWLAYLTKYLTNLTSQLTLPSLPSIDFNAWASNLTSLIPSAAVFNSLILIITDPTYQAWVGGGALLILLAIAIAIWFNRKRVVVSETKELEDSEIFVPDSGLSKSSNLDEHSLSTMTKKPELPGETSFITDFSPSEIDEGQQETGEVDPAAEADVYIAYGRYQQAENLITQTLDRFPDRLDLKLKLLEIYYTTRNVTSFTNMVEEMNADGISTSNPQAWSRICSMGQDLLPGHALFGNSERPTEPRRSGDAIAQGRAALQERNKLEIDEFNGLDLNLDTVLSEIPNAAGLEALRSKSVQALETPQPSKIPAPAIAIKTPQPPPAAKPIHTVTMPSSITNDVEQEFDIDLDLSGLPSLNDIDLAGLNFGDDTGMKEPKRSSPPIAITQPDITKPNATKSLAIEMEEDEVPAFNLYDLGIGSDFESITPSNKPTTALADNFNTLDSSEAVETKLDLARAYMEIDGEMAKGILEEVLREGNASQQATAKDLLASI